MPPLKTSSLKRWQLWPVGVWLATLLCLLYINIPLYSGAIGRDPDDALRADQVRDWLDHQTSWYDTRQVRMDVPPANMPQTWQGIRAGADVFSRLVDLPLAGVAAIGKLFGLTTRQGILVAAFIVPFCIQFPLQLYLLGWAFRPLFGAAAWLTTAIFAAYPGTLGEFLPGRIDHHGWQIVLLTLTLGAVLRLWIADERLADAATPPRLIARQGWLLALALCLSAVIGLEALPWQALLLGIVGWRLWQAPQVTRPATLSFATLAPPLALLLAFAFRTPAQLLQPTLYVYSLLDVKLITAAAIVFLLCTLVAPRLQGRWVRGIAFATIAAAAGAILLFDTPGLLQGGASGPWLGFDQWLVAFTRARAGDQQAMARYDALWPLAEGIVALTALGYYYGWKRYWQDRPQLRLLALWLGTFASVLGLLTLFYAARLDRFWYLLSIPGLWLALQAARGGIVYVIEQHPRRVLGFAALLALLPLGLLGWRGATGQNLALGMEEVAAHSGAGLTDVIGGGNGSCLCSIGRYLDQDYQTPQRILVYGSLGPELVWRTRHIVIGGGIYNNPYGLMVSNHFLKQTDAQLAARILFDNKIDLVLLRNLAGTADNWLKQTDDEYDWPLHADGPDTLLQRLNRGERFAWLQSVAVPLNDNAMFRLYRVDRAALAAALPH